MEELCQMVSGCTGNPQWFINTEIDLFLHHSVPLINKKKRTEANLTFFVGLQKSLFNSIFLKDDLTLIQLSLVLASSH